MREKFDDLLVKIWRQTSDDFFLKKSDRFNDAVSEALKRQISKASNELIKSRWQKVKLQNQLDDLKSAENDQN